jgi:hypothetical protein
MISIGYNIRQTADPLHQISIESLAKKIKQPDQRLITFIEQLRSVMTLDMMKYREMKVRLPYVVAATFLPPIRKITNFGKTQYFILDIDHLNEKNLDKQQLFKKICADPRTLLCFTSPSGDGLKVFFKLEEPVYDPARYSVFYKLFALEYSKQYSLDQVVDKVTSDVSRACFVSYDPELFFNNNPQVVSTRQIVDFENQYSLMENLNNIKQQEKEITHTGKETSYSHRQELPADIIKEIRDQLNPSLKEKRERKVYVPEEINEVLPMIAEELQKFEMTIAEVKNIHYGKQLKIMLQQWWGEINIFYGKKGYTIVKSAKSGSNEQITEISATIIGSLLSGPS